MNGLNLDSILDNFGPQLAGLWTTIVILCYLLGFGLCGSALTRYLNTTGQRVSHAASIWMMIAGTLMLNAPRALDVAANSLLAQDSLQSISYGSYAAGNLALGQSFVNFFFTAAAILGLIAILRGFWLLKDVADAQQTGTGGKAIMHIVAGSMAINLVPVIKILAMTGGQDLLSTVEKFIN